MSSEISAFTARPLSKAVVPAAGFGSRLRPLTNAIPKELLPIGREPVLAHIVRELRIAGITDVLFVISERKPQIRAYFGDVYRGDSLSPDIDLPEIRCEYVVQEEQKGSGHALLCAKDWVGDEHFVVAFGDCLIESKDPAAPLKRLIATHRSRLASASILVESVAREHVFRYGVIAPAKPLADAPTEPFALADIIEKPRIEDAPSNLVVAARWALGPTIFDALPVAGPDPRGEQNIPDAIRILLQRKEPCWAVPLLIGEARRDIGNMESFLVESVRMALRDSVYGEAARRIAAAELQ